MMFGVYCLKFEGFYDSCGCSWEYILRWVDIGRIVEGKVVEDLLVLSVLVVVICIVF